MSREEATFLQTCLRFLCSFCSTFIYEAPYDADATDKQVSLLIMAMTGIEAELGMPSGRNIASFDTAPYM